MYVINVVLINHVLNLGAHVLFGGEKKVVPSPALFDHSWTAIGVYSYTFAPCMCRRWTHPVQEHLQETQTRGEHMNSTEKDPCRSFLMWSNSATNQSPHAALKSWSCKAIHCVCQMNVVENKVLNFPLKYNEVKVLTKWKYSILYTVGSEEVKPVHGGHSTHYMTEDHRVPLVACSVTHHVLEHVPPEPQC